MIDYKANFQTDGVDFPDTAAINDSTPGAGDGTEFIALLVNDYWGARQALMYYAGLTPNGSSENRYNSQALIALTSALSPPGTVFASHIQGTPSSLNFRFLILQGQGIIRASYPELDAYCYVGDGNNPTAEYFYRANDSGGTSRSTTGAYLILPDMRGAFARGYDLGGTRDPEGPFRIFPDSQDFAFQEHHHNLITDSGSLAAQANLQVDLGTTYNTWTAVTDPGAPTNKLFGQEAIDPGDHSSTVGINIASETRPVNVQVKWWIRY